MKSHSKDALTQKVLDWIKKEELVFQGDRVLCALSGGADSLAMTLLLHENRGTLGIGLAAAHVNHGLRGAEADRDEEFCRGFCEKHGISFYPLRGNAAELALKLGTGTEDAARSLRYSLLNGIEADKIAVAHNADDNLETVVMRLVRGGGARGLSGIPPKNGKVIRPVMVLDRCETESFCISRGETWVTDSTNLSDDYLRNRLRHGVVSELKAVNPRASELVLENSLRLRQEDAFLDGEAQRLINGAGGLTSELLANSDPVLSRRALRLEAEKSGVSLDGKTVEKLLSLSLSGKSRFSFDVTGARFSGEYGKLRFEKERHVSGFCFPLVPGCPVETGEWRITMVPRGENFENIYKIFKIFTLGSDTIHGELVIRSRKEGDTFSRNVGSGTKKLNRVFSDMKLPAVLRDTLPLLADGKGIIFVPKLGANFSRKAETVSGEIFDVIFEEKI